ncbi:hypothetical protein [Edaphobacter aggregans]|uniref:hypothetical protein n=1 Tax=Edaphobacter aggregans TaxID=570835 RepID=UPI000F749290|nr:hypothetical protein [Edaphobacter aggregans]
MSVVLSCVILSGIASAQSSAASQPAPPSTQQTIPAAKPKKKPKKTPAAQTVASPAQQPQTPPPAPQQNKLILTGPAAQKLSDFFVPDSDTLQIKSDKAVNVLVNGVSVAPGTLQAGTPVTALVPGTGCSVDSLSGIVVAASSTALVSGSTLLKAKQPIDANITLGEAKAVDQLWLKQKLNAAVQALAGINPWSASQITSQYGAIQGSTNANSYIAGQLNNAGTPGAQIVTNNSPTSTTQNQYTAQCPSGFTAAAIATGNGVTCTANNGTASTGNATVTSIQTNPGTNSVQITQTVPAFTASVPSVPTGATAPSVPTNVGINPLDALSQQVQLNSELTMYQLLYNGTVSDNYAVNSSGAVTGIRRQMTLAFPVTISGFLPYKNALAEVRVILVPHAKQDDRMSLMNLFPQARTYNVARVTTNTKQFGAGVAIEALGIGVNGGKSKSTLYLVKDTDTVALQDPGFDTNVDKDGRSSIIHDFHNLSPVGECSSDLPNNLKKLGPDYDADNVLIFGWQFRPVLGESYPDPGQRLVFAQVALNQTDLQPRIFVQTRWREYDQEHQVAGRTYRDSCSWRELPNQSPLFKKPTISDMNWVDAGSGNLLIETKGAFLDPNLQVRIGTTQRAPDFVAGDETLLQVQAPTSSIIAAADISLIGTSGNTSPFVNTNTSSLTNSTITSGDCTLNTVTAEAVPSSSGNSLVSVDLTYGKARTQNQLANAALILQGTDVYGLTTHPYLFTTVPTPDQQNPTKVNIRFIAKTDSITANPAVVVRDLAWTAHPVIAPIAVGPTFTAVQSLAVDTTTPQSSDTPQVQQSQLNPPKPATGANNSPKSGQANSSTSARAANAPVANSTKLPRPPTSTQKGTPPPSPAWYEVTGTGMLQIKTRDCLKTAPSCLQMVSPKAPVLLQNIDPDKFVVLDDYSALIGPIGPLTTDTPLRLVWNDPVATGIQQEWDISLKKQDADSTSGKITATPSQLSKGDSLSVVFKGQDFTSISTVTFENIPLTILAKDKTSLTVLVSTQVTASAGSKTLIATPSTGKPVLLPITVYSMGGSK